MRCSLTSSSSKSLGGTSKPPRLPTPETTPPPPWEGEMVARGLIPGRGSSSRTGSRLLTIGCGLFFPPPPEIPRDTGYMYMYVDNGENFVKYSSPSEVIYGRRGGVGTGRRMRRGGAGAGTGMRRGGTGMRRGGDGEEDEVGMGRRMRRGGEENEGDRRGR